jgi:hypothetical protein
VYDVSIEAIDHNGHHSGYCPAIPVRTVVLDPALPVTHLTEASNTYDEVKDITWLEWTWVHSPSRIVVGYRMYLTPDGGEATTREIGYCERWTEGLTPGSNWTMYIVPIDRFGREGTKSAELDVAAEIGTTWSEPPNLSFELADPNDPTLPWGWTRTVTEACTFVRTGLDHHDGRNCVKMYWDSAGYCKLESLFFPASVGDVSYRLDFWMKGALGAEQPRMFVAWYDEDFTLVGSDLLLTVTCLSEWAHEESATLAPPAGTSWGKLILDSPVPPSGAVTVYWDQLRWTRLVPREGLLDGAVGTSELADNSVTLAKMTDSSVGTSELVNDGVTDDKLSHVGTAGTYERVTTNAQGRVTAGSNPSTRQVAEMYRAYSATTNSQTPEGTSLADLDSMSVSFSLSGTRDVIVEFYARLERATGSTRCAITDGSNNVVWPTNTSAYQRFFSLPASTSGTTEQEIRVMGQISLGSGSWTLKVRHESSQTQDNISWYERYLKVEILEETAGGGVI